MRIAINDLTTATIHEIRPGEFDISLDQYYSKYGEFKMVITQPLERAIRTFMAALKYDSEEEDKK